MMNNDGLLGSERWLLILAAAVVGAALLTLAVGIAYVAPIVGQALHEAPDVLLDWPGRVVS